MSLLKTVCLSLLLVSTANAMRCGDSLVREGDYIDVLLTECGAPDFVFRDVSIRGDRVVYIYRKNGRKQVVITRDNQIEEIR